MKMQYTTLKRSSTNKENKQMQNGTHMLVVSLYVSIPVLYIIYHVNIKYA